ncbi:50S ribosomal protein L9, partial [Elusimicrobiota bacterium]
EIKDVTAGFARNFLIPKRLVMEANAANMKIWEREKIKLEKEREQIINEAKTFAEKITKVSLTINMKVGENGKLFGSVTNSDIAEAFKNSGLEIKKHAILLPEPIKEIGAFTVNVRVHPEVVAEAKVWVVEEKSEESK